MVRYLSVVLLLVAVAVLLQQASATAASHRHHRRATVAAEFSACTVLQPGDPISPVAASPAGSGQELLHGTTVFALNDILTNGLQKRDVDKDPELGRGFYLSAGFNHGTSLISTVHRRCVQNEEEVASGSEKRNFALRGDNNPDAAIGIFTAKSFWAGDRGEPAAAQYFTMSRTDISGGLPIQQMDALPKGWHEDRAIAAREGVRCYFVETMPPAPPNMIELFSQAFARPQTADTAEARQVVLENVAQVKANVFCYDDLELSGYLKIEGGCAMFGKYLADGRGMTPLGDHGRPEDMENDWTFQQLYDAALTDLRNALKPNSNSRVEDDCRRKFKQLHPDLDFDTAEPSDKRKACNSIAKMWAIQNYGTEYRKQMKALETSWLRDGVLSRCVRPQQISASSSSQQQRQQAAAVEDDDEAEEGGGGRGLASSSRAVVMASNASEQQEKEQKKEVKKKKSSKGLASFFGWISRLGSKKH